jgi:hypothetical protein
VKVLCLQAIDKPGKMCYNMMNKFAKNYRMEVTYYYGYIVEFKKTNVYAISPHKIVFTKYGYNLLVLHCDDHHANENLFFISEENSHIQLVP